MNKEKLIPELRFPEFVNEEEWNEKKLGELIDIKGRIGYRGYTLDDIVNKGEGAVSMSPSNIDENGTLNFEKSTYITWAKYEESPEIILQKGFTVLVKTGSTYGKVAFINNLSEKVTINPQLVVLKPTNIDSFFLYLIVSNASVQRQIKATVVGGAIPTLSQDSISRFKVLIPPDFEKKEQQKIASCLSSLDEVIAAHSQKLELLKDHKKGLMQNLFPQEGVKVPKVRFPEFKNDGEWVEKRVKEVFSIFQGYAFSSEASVPRGVRWLKIADVGIQQMKEDNPTFLPSNFINEYKKFLVKKGDYVLALTRPILNMELKIAPVDDTFHNALLNQRVGKIMTSQSSSFVYYLLHTKKMVVNINKNIAGNEPPNLSFQQIENIGIYIPREIKEQQKIASCFSSLDALIIAQAEKIEQLKLHKKGLMQGLFPK